MVAGGRRFGRCWENELGWGARRCCSWFVAGRFDLVLPGAPLWKPRAKPPLPHFIGARLLCASDAGCVHKIWNERRRCGEIHSRPEHPGATAGGQFFSFDGAGSLLYGGAFILVGFLFSHQLEQVIDALASLGGRALALVGGLAALYIGFKYLQRHRLLRELRMARITADELHQKQESGENLVVLDLRPHAELKQNPSLIRGALHMTMDEVERRQQELPRDRDIILYCSCPNEVSSARVALLLRQKGIQRVRPLLGGIDAWREQNYPMELSTINMATALDSGAKSREVTLIQETLGQVSAAAEPQPSLKPNETARQD